MKNKNYILRLLTLAIYFLPFCFFYVSCSHDTIAYNKKDADKMKSDTLKKIFADSATEVISDSISPVSNDSTDVIYQKDTTKFSYIFGEWWDKTLYRAMFPSESSISGFGCIQYFKNDIGELFIGMSLFLSIASLVWERFFRKKNKLIIDFIAVNLVAVLAFIIDGFINHVELKYGVWCLLIILILQFMQELKQNSDQNTV